MITTYLLISHGSSDPRPQIGVERLACLVQQQLQSSETTISASTASEKIRGTTALLTKQKQTSATTFTLVGTASLECTPIPLQQQIQDFASQVALREEHCLQIIPLFLSAGVHVKEDIPREVTLAQQSLGNTASLKLNPHLGSNPRLKSLVAQQFSQFPAQERILLAHGSRRPGANEEIERLASYLGAKAAYWSVKPSLYGTIMQFYAQKARNITIIPYFLFAGGIFQAIACQIEELKTAFPSLNLYLGNPLGATPALAQAIVEEVQR